MQCPFDPFPWKQHRNPVLAMADLIKAKIGCNAWLRQETERGSTRAGRIERRREFRSKQKSAYLSAGKLIIRPWAPAMLPASRGESPSTSGFLLFPVKTTG
jgi:hypothetical protein